MDTDFWLERWAKSETGFHQQHTNEYLKKYWSQLAVPQGTIVFVPLCGKSLDMLWLYQQGHPVLGVELARTAVSEFFKEWGADAQVTSLVTSRGAFEQWSAPRGAPISTDGKVTLDPEVASDMRASRDAAPDAQVFCDAPALRGAHGIGAHGITVLCGDFFNLEPSLTAHVGAVFDRAALIALPSQMRVAYARKLLEILPAGIPVLLITLDYDQDEMPGPPFAVSDREVHELFAGSRVERLAEVDVSAAPGNARFRQRGVSRLLERAYRIDTVI